MPIRLAALLLPLLATPALAADDLTDADRVAAIVIGFAGDGTAMVNGNETANVTRTGPGQFAATLEETGAQVSFAVVETAPCRFDASYASDDLSVVLAFDFGKIARITLTEGEEQTGYTFFNLEFEAPPEAVEIVADDGTRKPAGTRNRIGSSLTLAALEEAAAHLIKTCSAP